MYYLSRENKDADQLRGYREADLRLCFRIWKNPVFSYCGSYYTNTFSHDAVHLKEAKYLSKYLRNFAFTRR